MRNIKRNKGWSLFLLLLTFTIVLVTSVLIMIETTLKEAVVDYRWRFETEAKLRFDLDRLIESLYGGEANFAPTNRELLDYGESDLLEAVVYSGQLELVPYELATLWEKEERTLYLGPTNFNDVRMGDAIGFGDLLSHVELNQCLISENFAKANLISVGDTIMVKREQHIHPLVVVGIFEDEDESLVTKNDIVISLETLLEMDLFKYDDIGWLNPTFYLRHPDFLEPFYEELLSLGLPDHFALWLDEDTFNGIVGPLENMVELFSALKTSTLIFSSVTLLAVSFFFIQRRKYEINILQTMGLKKLKIVRGFIYESIIIISLGLILGFCTALIVAQPIANQALEAQGRAVTQEYQNEVMEPPELSLPTLIVRLTSRSLGQIMGVSFLLLILSSIMSVLYVRRHEPLKIIVERN